ncbi:MAG TPA: phospho-N-acetylmuramoyl-pentapeptide-transferase [Candidatus Dormibacteraeota bacterium]
MTILAALLAATPAPSRPVLHAPTVHHSLSDTLFGWIPQPWPPLWAFLIPLVLGIVVMPWVVGRLARAGMGQKIREEGPRSHMAKGGTPTSGGLAVIGLVVVTVALLDRSSSVVPALLAVLLGGGLGLLDDLVTVKSRSWTRGLLARQRIVMQVVVGGVVAIVLLRAHADSQVLPLAGTWRMGWLLIPFAAVALAAAANAFNLTDGSDGLAPGVMLFVALVLALLARNHHHQVGLVRLMLATAGALGAFLVFNVPPARVFLGGVGSEGLGMMLAAVAIGAGYMWFLPLIAIVPVLETVSVIAQVYVFKTTGRRLLRMSPLHHHFQLGGWSEWTVALAAWATTCLAGTVTLLLARKGP